MSGNDPLNLSEKTNHQQKIRIIGGGLDGSEAAFQLATQGIQVELWEMRPKISTPAHQTSYFSELVCSNSFKGLSLTGAHGLFKEELRLLGSFIMEIAHACKVPAGESLHPFISVMSLDNHIKNSFGQEVGELTEHIFTTVHIYLIYLQAAKMENEFKSTRNFSVYNKLYINNLQRFNKKSFGH